MSKILPWITGPILLWWCAWLFSLFVGWTWAIVILLVIGCVVAITDYMGTTEKVFYNEDKEITIIKDDGTVETWQKK